MAIWTVERALRRTRTRKYLTGIIVAVITMAMLLPGFASARPGVKPVIAFAPRNGVREGAPIPFTWSARHVGDARFVVQRPVGTAHTWKTMMKLNGKGGSGELPGVPLGQYRYRVAALEGQRVLAQQVSGVSVFGSVPFSTLFASGEGLAESGTLNTPTATFPYVARYGSDQGALFSVQHNHCLFVHVGFAEDYPDLGVGHNTSTFSGSLTVIQESRNPVSAGAVPYEGIGSVDAELVPGQTWGVNASSTGGFEADVFLNGYAICDSTEGLFGN